MVKSVSDARSNSNEQIVHAVNIIGRSKICAKVFAAIYRGKKKIKTVEEIKKITLLNNIAILQQGKKLTSNGIVEQIKIKIKKKSETGYKKDEFYSAHYKKILSLVGNEKKIAQIPTKRNSTKTINIVKKISPSKMFKVKQITIDDIDNFLRVKKIKSPLVIKPILETPFKQGVQKIISEPGEFKDWGGEKNDLYSTRLKIKGKRLPVAFAFKGRGERGKLVPGKMGKNGDQLQRLFESSAQVFIIQYWGIVDESIIELMYRLAIAKSSIENKEVFFGIIDGEDTQRLIQAYPNYFPNLN